MHFPTHAGVRVHAILVLALALALLNGAADAEQLAYECGTLDNRYGPFDYSNPVHYRERLPIVERAHFNRDVESLRRGQTSHLPGEDLDYTLRAFPNHHRALYSMLQYHRRHPQAAKPPGTRYRAICWFQRAVVFAPHDPVAHMLYGLFLSQSGDGEGARRQFELSVALEPDSAEAHYNYGLVLVDLGDYDKALEHAHRAYALGFPLPGLRNKLTRAGHWKALPASTDDGAGDVDDESR
jgi:tetratricopeptide (TPR) repeat protein